MGRAPPNSEVSKANDAWCIPPSQRTCSRSVAQHRGLTAVICPSDLCHVETSPWFGTWPWQHLDPPMDTQGQTCEALALCKETPSYAKLLQDRECLFGGLDSRDIGSTAFRFQINNHSAVVSRPRAVAHHVTPPGPAGCLLSDTLDPRKTA